MKSIWDFFLLYIWNNNKNRFFTLNSEKSVIRLNDNYTNGDRVEKNNFPRNQTHHGTNVGDIMQEHSQQTNENIFFP